MEACNLGKPTWEMRAVKTPQEATSVNISECHRIGGDLIKMNYKKEEIINPKRGRKIQNQ